MESGDRRAQKLADPVSFFTYKRKYLKLAAIYRRGKRSGDWLRLWCGNRCSVQKSKEGDLY